MPENGLNKEIDVSVVIPAFNPGSFLRQSIASVQSQKGLVAEVIVVDDGSTDETPTVLEELRPEIITIRIPNSGGPSVPRNTGLRAASSEFISFFDADDVMLPGKLKDSLSALRAHPNVGIVFTDFQGIDGNNRVIRENWLAEYKNFRTFLEPTDSGSEYILKAEDAFPQLLRANFIGTSSVICRKSALVEVGFFCEEMKNSDDRDMWYRVARAGWDFVFIDRVYHSYRKSGAGVTARGGARNIAIIQGYMRQLPFIEADGDRKFVLGRIRDLWAGYAYWLRKSGHQHKARQAYQTALGYGFRPRILLGWLKTWFGF